MEAGQMHGSYRRGLLSGFAIMLSVIALTCISPSIVRAEVVEDVATEEVEAKDSTAIKMSLGEVFETGGWVMYVLTIFSLLTVSLVVFFLLSMRSSQAGPKDFHEEVVKLIRLGAFDDAVRLCEFRQCALSSIAMAGLEHQQSVSDMEPTILKDVLEGAGARESDRMQGRAQYLLDIAVISPMLGLLGTVFGMLRAFQAVALDIASAKPVVLAGGVREALITTACGLLVGIPAMIFYAAFRRRASVLASTLEAQTAGIFNAFCIKRIR